jgi:uncharacterized membrane protein YkoI
MKEFISKLKEKLTKNNKKTAKIAAIVVAGIFIIAVTAFSIIYFRARANIKYSQDQLEKIALKKVKGEVVGVDKKLNFKKDSFEYDFKIKTPNNVLREVKTDSEYGVVLNANKQNKNEDNNTNEE